MDIFTLVTGRLDDENQDVEQVFTSELEFRPLTLKFYSNNHLDMFYGCSIQSGQFFIVRQYDKGATLCDWVQSELIMFLQLLNAAVLVTLM
jgi:hypothetical protein